VRRAVSRSASPSDTSRRASSTAVSASRIVSQLLRERRPALPDSRRRRRYQAAVLGQPQRRPEQLERHRLLAGDLPLQRPLAAQALAVVEKGRLVELLASRDSDLDELLGDDQVGVEERPEDQLRHVRPRLLQPLGGVERAVAGVDLLDAVGVDELELLAQFHHEVAQPGEEELEVEQVSQLPGLLPQGHVSVLRFALRGRREGHLPDRAVHEHVRGAVAGTGAQRGRDALPAGPMNGGSPGPWAAVLGTGVRIGAPGTSAGPWLRRGTSRYLAPFATVWSRVLPGARSAPIRSDGAGDSQRRRRFCHVFAADPRWGPPSAGVRRTNQDRPLATFPLARGRFAGWPGAGSNRRRSDPQPMLLAAPEVTALKMWSVRPLWVDLIRRW
jgi:hypothetical protein